MDDQDRQAAPSLEAVYAKYPVVSDHEVFIQNVRNAHKLAVDKEQVVRTEYNIMISQDEDGQIYTTVGFTNHHIAGTVEAAVALRGLCNKVELVENNIVPADELFSGYKGPAKKPDKEDKS